MEAFSGLVVIAIIVGLVIYFNNKKKQEQALAEEKAKKEAALAEERRKKELEELEIRWNQKKEEFSKNGLPIIDDETLKLTKNEVCHFVGDASFCKVKQETKGYEGGSRGVSFRVMKGVSFRVGNYKGHPIKEEVIDKTSGIIYLTSKKIVFSALTHSRVIKYKDIINLNVFETMLQIQTEDRAYLFEIADSFNFMVILEYIINQDNN